ncbi:unnamed protein product [Closterium sp. NIES-54]
MRGDVVIHHELALPFLTGLVTSCSPPLCLWGHSFLHYFDTIDPFGTVRPRPYFVPLLQLVLRTLPSATLTPPLLCPPPDKSQPPLLPASPLLAPSPYTEQCGGLTQRREPASCPVLLVRTARRVPRSRPPLVSGMHAMNLRPSSLPLRVPLPAPPESSLPEVPDPESNHVRAASPIVSRLLATAVTDPSFESAAASALLAELLDCSAPCRLDYATALVADSASASPPSIEAAMDAEMASWKSTGPFVDEVPPPGVNIVDGMWIFRVKRPPGSPPAFKAPTTLAALGFSPSTADPSPFLRTDNLVLPLYVLVYVDDLVFATADTEALTLVKSELQKRHTCTDLGELRSYLGLQITRDRARHTIIQTQSHMVHQVLQRFGFYTSGMGLVLGRRGPVVVTGHVDASLVDDSATQRSSRSYTFSLDGAADGLGAPDGTGAADGAGAVNGRGATDGAANGLGAADGATNGHGIADGAGAADGRGAVDGVADGPGAADGPGVANRRGAADGPGVADGPGSAEGPGAAASWGPLGCMYRNDSRLLPNRCSVIPTFSLRIKMM